jgi:tetratricopeptide (TPR) repeat protein
MPNIQYEIPDNLLLEAKELIDMKDYERLSTYSGLTNKFKRLYDPFNYIYAAHRLGIIKKVIWVIPISKSIEFDYRDFFKERLMNNPNLDYTPEDINSFEYTDNKLEGRVFGIPITVLNINDLGILDEPVIISINMTYLNSFVIDNVRSPIENIAVAFLSSFSKLPLQTNYITIVNSNKTFEVTLQFRFIANIIKEMLQEPHLVGNVKREWIMRQFADKKLFFVEYDDAIKEYKAILELTPDDPSVYYQLAIVYYKRGDYDKVVYYIEEAIKRDENYELGYLDIISPTESEDKKLKLLQIGYERHSENIPIINTIADMYFRKDKFQEALDAYLKLISLGIESYDYNFYVAECYFRLKNYDKAKEVYNNTFDLLTDDYKLYFSSSYVNLAETYENLNDIENAIKNYELYLKYNQASPGGNEIKLRLIELKSKKGL